ncbi:hypothetical protein VTO73DRAFT_11966 [Trametes versicolor]
MAKTPHRNIVYSSDLEDNPPPPAPKSKNNKSQARPPSDDEDDDEDVEVAPSKGKQRARATEEVTTHGAARARTKPQRAATPSGDEQEDADEPPPAPKTFKNKNKARAISGNDDDKSQPTAKSLTKGKQRARARSDDDDEDADAEASHTTKSTAKGKKRIRSPSDDDDDEPAPMSEASQSTHHRPKDGRVKVKRPRKPHAKRLDLPNTGAAMRKLGGRFEWRNTENRQAAEWLTKFLDEIDSIDDTKMRHTRERQIAAQCLEEFSFAGETDGDMETRIHTFFKNRLQQRHKAAREGQQPETPTNETGVNVKHEETGVSSKMDLAPLLKSLKARAPSASNLWAAEHKDLVERRREELGGSIGARQQAKAELFRALTTQEQAQWAAKAQEAKDQRLSNPDAYLENQEGFPNLLAEHLRRFVGFEPNQIGAAVMHLRLAYRNAAGIIERDQFTIRLDDDITPFSDFEGGPSESEVDRWTRYVDIALPPNPSRQDPRLEYDSSGRPLLPEYDAAWNMVQAAEVLDAWFRAVWSYVNPDGDGSSLNWGALRTVYIPSIWRDAGIKEPSSVPLHLLPALYVRLYEAQDMSEAFKWQKPADETVGAPRQASRAPTEALTTPRRTMKTVFVSPSKRTPTTSRLVTPFSPAEGSTLMWPTTSSTRHSRAPSVAQSTAPSPNHQQSRPRPASQSQTTASLVERRLETIAEAAEAGAASGGPGWVALRLSAGTDRSAGSSVEGTVEALIDELEDDVEAAASQGAAVEEGVTVSASQGAAVEEDVTPSRSYGPAVVDVPRQANHQRSESTSPPPPRSSPASPPRPALRRLSRARPTSQPDNNTALSDGRPAPDSSRRTVARAARVAPEDEEACDEPPMPTRRQSLRTHSASVPDDNAESGEDSPSAPASPPKDASEDDEPVASSSPPAASSSRNQSSKEQHTKRRRASAVDEGPSAKR